MYVLHDPDEWEAVYEYTSYGEFAGHPMGAMTCGQRRRPPEEVARIKAEKRLAHENKILAEADAIRARRASEK